MPRSRHRRRRPGRRPPDRLASCYRHAPAGFTPGPLAAFYRMLLPTLGGAEKRAYFNRVSLGPVAAAACGGAFLGAQRYGVPGAALGLAAGVWLGAAAAARARFYRG